MPGYARTRKRSSGTTSCCGGKLRISGSDFIPESQFWARLPKILVLAAAALKDSCRRRKVLARVCHFLSRRLVWHQEILQKFPDAKPIAWIKKFLRGSAIF